MSTTEAISFTVKHEDEGKKYEFTFWVKPEFATVCPNYMNESFLDLFVNHKMPQYWHNPHGACITGTIDGVVIDNALLEGMGFPKDQEFGLNGKAATKEQIERLKFNKDFEVKFDDVILKAD